MTTIAAPWLIYVRTAVLTQVNLSQFTWLFMPINLSGIHWALLAAHVPTCTVSVVDSLSMPSGNTYLSKWRYDYFYLLCIPIHT